MSFNTKNVTQIQRRAVRDTRKTNKSSPRKGEKTVAQRMRLSFVWDPKEFMVLTQCPFGSSGLEAEIDANPTPRNTALNYPLDSADLHLHLRKQSLFQQSIVSSSSSIGSDMDDGIFNATSAAFHRAHVTTARRSSMSTRKRPSLTTLGQSEKYSGSNKKMRTEGPSPYCPSPHGDVVEFEFQSGDYVRVVHGAKDQYMGKLARVEKFLTTKDKWGILIGGKRIALGSQCLKFVKHRREQCTRWPSVGMLKTAKSTRARAKAPAMRPNVPRVVRALVKPDHLHIKDHIEHPMVKQASSGTIETYQERLTCDSHFKFAMGLWPLLELAVRDGRSSIAKALIMTNKCDINVETGSFQNALHIACIHKRPKCALLLIEMGIETCALDAVKKTPLMYAAENGLIEVIIALVQAGANVEHKDHEGYTALMLACREGHSDCVDILLEAGAHLDTENDHHANALMVALQGGHTQIAEKLMKKLTENDSMWEANEKLHIVRKKPNHITHIGSSIEKLMSE